MMTAQINLNLSVIVVRFIKYVRLNGRDSTARHEILVRDLFLGCFVENRIFLTFWTVFNEFPDTSNPTIRQSINPFACETPCDDCESFDGSSGLKFYNNMHPAIQGLSIYLDPEDINVEKFVCSFPWVGTPGPFSIIQTLRPKVITHCLFLRCRVDDCV
jgi:hypothetical protein